MKKIIVLFCLMFFYTSSAQAFFWTYEEKDPYNILMYVEDDIEEWLCILYEFDTTRFIGIGDQVFKEFIETHDPEPMPWNVYSYEWECLPRNWEWAWTCFDTSDCNPVPEPATLLLFAIGIIGISIGYKKRMK